MNIHQYFDHSKKRISVLLCLTVILLIWSLILPPTDDLYLQYTNIPRIEDDKVTSSEVIWHEVQSSKFVLDAWNLVAIVPEKHTLVAELPTAELTTKSNSIQIPSIDVNTSLESITPMIQLPSIQYLGQAFDSAGLQIFLSIDSENVMIRADQTSQGNWKILSVDNYAIQLLHLPSQQTISVSKS